MQDSAKSVCLVGQECFEDGYFKRINISWPESKFGQGPTGKAIRMGSTKIVKDIMADSNYGPWRTEASRRGYASSVALLLSDNRYVLGALNILYVNLY